MKKRITCYIRRNRSDYISNKLFPYLMETYPDNRNRNKYLHRRDFECRTVKECERIGNAVYGEYKTVFYYHKGIKHETK